MHRKVHMKLTTVALLLSILGAAAHFMTQQERVEELIATARAIPASDHQANIDAYSDLIGIQPDVQEWKDKVKLYEGKQSEREQKEDLLLADNADGSWYVVDGRDPVLEEVVKKAAVVDGTDDEGLTWQLIVRCNRLANVKKESPFTVVLKTPFDDLWLGSRESAMFLVFEGRIKTDKNSSERFYEPTISHKPNIGDDEISLTWGDLNEAEQNRYFRGTTLKIWPFYKSVKLVARDTSASEVEIGASFRKETVVTFNLGNVESGTETLSDIYISKIREFCVGPVNDYKNHMKKLTDRINR